MPTLEKILKESAEQARNGKLKAKRKTWLCVTETLRVQITPDGEPILPAEFGPCSDLLYQVREERLAREREIDRLKTVESKLKEFFINRLSVKQATGVAGQLARVQIKPEKIPQVSDWPKFYAYVRRKNAFDLLHKALTLEAARDRLAEGEKIPGITIFNAKKVSCVKL